jgi:hypothetical protein
VAFGQLSVGDVSQLLLDVVYGVHRGEKLGLDVEQHLLRLNKAVTVACSVRSQQVQVVFS